MFGKTRPPFAITLRRVVAPLALVLALTAAGLGYYFWRVTGSLVRMPYQIERQTYAVAPYMIWQPVRPEPVYHHAVMRKMYTEEELFGYNYSRTFAGVIWKVFVGWNFFLGPALTLPMLLLPFVLPQGFGARDISPPTRILLFLFLASVFTVLSESFYSPHYSAPATALLVALVLLSLKKVRSWGRQGVFLARAIPVICVLSFGIRVAAAPLHIQLGRLHVFGWQQQGAPRFGREESLARLAALPGKQLVMVRYKPDRPPFSEWVYNEADIDHAKVVWAREMDPLENRRLIDYFKGRQLWLLEADENPPRLTTYTGASPVAASPADLHATEESAK
jgi:hypothetical protein